MEKASGCNRMLFIIGQKKMSHRVKDVQTQFAFSPVMFAQPIFCFSSIQAFVLIYTYIMA